jgi:hypothetical protein
VLVAVPLAIVAVTGPAAQARPDRSLARAAYGGDAGMSQARGASADAGLARGASADAGLARGGETGANQVRGASAGGETGARLGTGARGWHRR